MSMPFSSSGVPPAINDCEDSVADLCAEEEFVAEGRACGCGMSFSSSGVPPAMKDCEASVADFRAEEERTRCRKGVPVAVGGCVGSLPALVFPE